MIKPPIFTRLSAFEWDRGNRDKNWKKHRVTNAECEEVFFSRPLVAGEDADHSAEEPRFYVLGRTQMERRLFVIFTVRGDRIRVISARDMTRKERKAYEEADSEVS